jgi:formate transporter
MILRKEVNVFIFGILAGLSIALGAAAYTACTYYGQPIMGSIFFACGLLMVCAFGFKLFTGQIGKVFENKPIFLLDLVVMYVGNFVGAAGAGLLASLIVPNDAYQETINNISNGKLCLVGDIGCSWYKLLISSIFCGILVYLAVEIFKKAEHGVVKVTGLILCVAVFVICGFQHCVANMFYLGNSLYLFKYPLESFLSLLICTFGNSIGAIVIWLGFYIVQRNTNKIQKNETKLICTPNPGQKQERGIFHEIHSKIQT